MKIEEKVRGRVAVLSLAGEFDTVEVEAFESAVASLVKRGLTRVCVSLEKLTFINSTALGVFIREHERFAAGSKEG